jgi:hypothetical protein
VNKNYNESALITVSKHSHNILDALHPVQPVLEAARSKE